MNWQREPLEYRKGECLNSQAYPKNPPFDGIKVDLDFQKPATWTSVHEKQVAVKPLVAIIGMMYESIKAANPQANPTYKPRSISVADEPMLVEIFSNASQQDLHAIMPPA